MVVKELIVMSTSAVDSEYMALEAILLEYVERYGLTPAARQFFADQALASAQKSVVAPIPFRARRTA